MKNSSIGVVGLGLMGTAIAKRFMGLGVPLCVWNRTRDKAVDLIRLGARWSDHPFVDCSHVIVSLYSSDVVHEVVCAMRADLRPGQIIIDTTTGEPDDARRLADELAALGVEYLAAPISGSSQQTMQGEALVMVGGNEAVFGVCRELWSHLGKQVIYTGDCESAAKMKLVTNLVLGLNRAALAEGLAYAGAIGLSEQSALDVLKASAAYARVMDIKGQKMVQGDFATQAKLSQHLKDVRIILQTAHRAGMPLPLSDLHRQLLERAEARGYGELDNSAIIRLYEGESGE